MYAKYQKHSQFLGCEKVMKVAFSSEQINTKFLK